ncbi:MAG: hypothetical protein PHS44_07095 [Candidatus Dojkabacteria bacterium]|nr:hypothetical protein [Candidatus Dojkabacteria bacterium]
MDELKLGVAKESKRLASKSLAVYSISHLAGIMIVSCVLTAVIFLLYLLTGEPLLGKLRLAMAILCLIWLLYYLFVTLRKFSVTLDVEALKSIPLNPVDQTLLININPRYWVTTYSDMSRFTYIFPILLWGLAEDSLIITILKREPVKKRRSIFGDIEFPNNDIGIQLNMNGSESSKLMAETVFKDSKNITISEHGNDPLGLERIENQIDFLSFQSLLVSRNDYLYSNNLCAKLSKLSKVQRQFLVIELTKAGFEKRKMFVSEIEHRICKNLSSIKKEAEAGSNEAFEPASDEAFEPASDEAFEPASAEKTLIWLMLDATILGLGEKMFNYLYNNVPDQKPFLNKIASLAGGISFSLSAIGAEQLR